MKNDHINWVELGALSEGMAVSDLGPGSFSAIEWKKIESALDHLIFNEDWAGVVRLREMFSFLIVGEAFGSMTLVERLNQEAIKAALSIEDIVSAARFLHDQGQHLHQKGYHNEAVEAFKESTMLYQQASEAFRSLESFYMTALCHRALGNRSEAKQILTQVLQESVVTPLEDDAWRGNPLQVMAWLAKDEGQLDEAERLLRQALILYEQYEGSNSIFVAQTLADLGEVIGVIGRYEEASTLFQRSLAITKQYKGQYDRQEARTKLKFSTLLMRHKEYVQALRFLNEADDQIRTYGHYYDLLWQIELARAFIYLRQRKIVLGVRKLRLVLRYRQALGLSNVMLARQVLTRLLARAGLSR